MLNKLFISFIILSMVSCAEQKKSVEQNMGINGKWVYIGWQKSKDSSVMAGGFFYEERYWEVLNFEITIYDNASKKKGTMKYSTNGDTIKINNRLNFLYSLNNDTLRMKELFSESNVWKVLIRK